MSGGVMERRALLEHLRDRLLVEFDASEGRDSAFIAKQLAETARELESLPTGVRSTVDDLAAKRAARRAETAG